MLVSEKKELTHTKKRLLEKRLNNFIKSISAEKQLSLDDILQTVSNRLEIEKNTVLSKSRKRELVYCRQIAMYLSKYCCGKISLKSIGDFYGGRDHTTVIHAKDTLNDLMDTEENVINDVERVIADLESHYLPTENYSMTSSHKHQEEF